MSSKNATSRPRYTINKDGLTLHDRWFARCGDSSNIYILPESGKREISYLGVQRSGRYWYVVELLMDDRNNVYHSIVMCNGYYIKDRFATISQAAKQLINISDEEDKWYDSISN